MDKKWLNCSLVWLSCFFTINHNIPKVIFNKKDESDKHQAIVQFPEGDFEISISGEDKAGNSAIVNFEGKKGKEATAVFSVDETAPVVETNFGDFSNTKDTKVSLYNKVKTATITVREHNFDSELMDLKVYEKMPGNGYKLVKDDGVYLIKIAPKDMAGNKGEKEQTAVFEIDRTAPVIVSRNGVEVESNKTRVVDVYDYDKKDDANPIIKFDDINFDHIEYSVTQYIAKNENDKELDRIEGKTYSKIENSKKFELKDFKKDGVYAVEITAYDKAGNTSKVITDTYMKMVNSDVLAYIENSHPGIDGSSGSGWYSIEDEFGAISKRPEDFEDIDIAVFSKDNTSTSVSLNDNNGNVIDMGLTAEVTDVAYGLNLNRYTIKGEYFKDTFQKDTDATYYLTVNSGAKKYELGQVHIDNIAPECDLPEYYHDWGWIKGNNPKPVKISNINEKLDPELTAVYVDGKKIKYNYDMGSNTLEFNLEKGTHSVGISLVDMAGNRYDIPEINNLGVGNFRIYMGFGTGAVIIAFLAIIYALKKRKKQRG